jgi:hypothetical protein
MVKDYPLLLYHCWACLYPSRTSNEQHQASTKTQRISAQRDAQLCVKRERTAIANTPVKTYIGDLLCNTYTSKGVRTKYQFGKGAEVGRVYPDGPSLGNFPRVIRELLSHGNMKDYDFANSALSDLSQLMDMHGFAAPLLREYVHDRDNILHSIMAAGTSVSLDDAKAAVLQVIMGGGFEVKGQDEKWADLSSVPWMVAFKQECTHTADSVCTLFPDVYRIKQHEDSPKGKAVAQGLFRIDWFNLEGLCALSKVKEDARACDHTRRAAGLRKGAA